MNYISELTSTEKTLHSIIDPLFHTAKITESKKSVSAQDAAADETMNEAAYETTSEKKHEHPNAAKTEKEHDAKHEFESVALCYTLENKIMHAIAQGQTQKAELLFAQLCECEQKKRLLNSIQAYKNECIVMNTLFRKAAESSDVHPIHIDSLCAKLTKKIEQASSIAALVKLQSELIHKYCILVKNHSLQGYSILIRQVLTRIDSDLTADLSLSTQAKLLNINSSYLSTLFKKEVGVTLTDYVNTKRVEQAIFLLNTTTLQIQTIAKRCGIADVNYFTKTFKKHVGKTPKDYRDSITLYRKHSE